MSQILIQKPSCTWLINLSFRIKIKKCQGAGKFWLAVSKKTLTVPFAVLKMQPPFPAHPICIGMWVEGCLRPWTGSLWDHNSLPAEGPKFDLCSTHAKTSWGPNNAFPWGIRRHISKVFITKVWRTRPNWRFSISHVQGFFNSPCTKNREKLTLNFWAENF